MNTSRFQPLIIGFVLSVILCAMVLSTSAQEPGDEGRGSTSTPTVSPDATQEADMVQVIRAEVQVESAFVRVLPLESAEPSASVFEDEPLQIVGRNLDGLWFEVRRPGRMNNLGWIFNEMLDWEFDPVLLPLTDLTTGLTGTTRLARDPDFAVFLLENAVLRRTPSVEANNRIGIVPISTTVPVTQRNQNGSWVFVNYLGTVGWISDYSIRTMPNVLALPIAPGLPPLITADLPIIPPEIQLEQLNRLRTYTLASRDLAGQLAVFWFTVGQGQTMPCEPPPFLADYPYTGQDVRELPELQRYVPRLATANFSLNTSIELLTICGAFDPDVIRTARNNAINAENIYDATLGTLDNLEENVIGQP